MNSKVQQFSQNIDKMWKIREQAWKKAEEYSEDCYDIDEDEMEKVKNMELGDFISKIRKKAEEFEKKFKKVVK